MLLFRLAGTNGKTQFSGPQGWKTQFLGRQTAGAAEENGITANGSCGPTPAKGLDRIERAGFFDDRARPARLVGLGGKIDFGCVAGEMAGSGMKLKGAGSLLVSAGSTASKLSKVDNPRLLSV